MKDKSGFTLIELAIVFVIIGLIIGGILVAGSLSSAAKAQGFMRDMQKYSVAVSNFQVSYNGYPGDSSLFQPPGDNNGQIEDTSGQAAQGYLVHRFDGEAGNFWIHLQEAGFIPKDKFLPPPIDPAPVIVGVHVPTVNYGKKGAGIFPENEIPVSSWTTNPLPNSNWFIVSIPDETGINILNPSLTTIEVAAIDIKMDDGEPYTGNVRGVNTGGSNQCVSYSPYEYSTYSPVDPNCYMLINMLLNRN